MTVLIPNLQLLKDWHLAVIVLIFVIVDLIILITVTAVDGVHYTVRTIHDAEHPTSVNVSWKLVDTPYNCAFTYRQLCYLHT